MSDTAEARDERMNQRNEAAEEERKAELRRQVGRILNRRYKRDVEREEQK